MSLTDPSVKMSKSDPKGDIFLKEPLESMRKKIMSAVTDSGNEVKYDPDNKPGSLEPPHDLCFLEGNRHRHG
jgi:tryptophanyl-tRNA synthetase